jgi:hypothetical protein
MTPIRWRLQYDRPWIEVTLSQNGVQDCVYRLVADTGAGTRRALFQLILTENDCLQCGGVLIRHTQLGGAYTGWFPVYLVEVRVPQLNFDEYVPIVGVPKVPQGFDGIAGLKFLNRFHYGNFGDADYFGLDLLASP